MRSEYISVHDVDPVEVFYPIDYDILLSDITHRRLESTIAEEFRIPHFLAAAEERPKSCLSE